MNLAASLLDNIETSGRFSLPPSYQEFMTAFKLAEWLAVRETYEFLDNFERKEGQNASSAFSEPERGGVISEDSDIGVPGSKMRTPRTRRLDDCRQVAWFVRNDLTGEVRVSANHCHLRWCPLCADAKKTFIAHNLMEWLKYADHPKMLTLTLLHSNSPLANQVQGLYDSFRKLRKTKLFRRTVTGGIWFFQIKFNPETEQWHPHIHALLTGRYVPQGQLSRLWLKITHTSKIVDIRPVTDPEKAAFEVARYCARPSSLKDVPKDRRTELFAAMHGRRLCGTWGKGRSVSLNQPRKPEPNTWTRLGRWNTIRSQIDYNPDAREIVDAWLNKKAIAPNVTLIEYDDIIDNVPLETEPEPPPKLLWES